MANLEVHGPPILLIPNEGYETRTVVTAKW